jgi:hypothetical protein
MTARFDQTRAIEPSLAMAFDVEPSAPLVLAASGGQGATYNTLGHLRHPLDAGIPTLQVFLVAEPPPEDMAAYLRAQIQRNGQQLFDAKVQLEAGLVIDGLDGFVVVASAQDALQLADRELVAFDALAPHPDGRRFAVMAGIATAEVSDELLPAFRETAESFRWRATP